MLVRRITFTAMFALVTAAMATFGTPTLAQSQDSDQKATVKQDKQAKQGWEKADNGSYVNPADDPRYPGASPSAGTVQTKDDMDSDGFKPKALIEGAQDDDADDEAGTVIVTRQEVTPAPVPQDQTDSTRTDVDTDVSTDVDTVTTTTDVDSSTQTDVDTTTTTAERTTTVNRTPTAPAATSTRRHTRLE
jgi:hypothetical protein